MKREDDGDGYDGHVNGETEVGKKRYGGLIGIILFRGCDKLLSLAQ